MSTASEGARGDEASRRARLPDLRAVELTEEEWERRAREAGLVCVFDDEGRPAGPSADDTYDAVEAELRAAGRSAEADRFAAMRPPRGPVDPPPEAFIGEPDPHRRGPPTADFELRVRPRDGHLTGCGIRALIEPGRASTGPWAWLTLVGDSLHVSGHWSRVPGETFERMLAASAAVFGSVPCFEPPPIESKVRSCRGGVCSVCHEAIGGLGIRVGFGDEPMLDEIRFHLVCARPDDVQRAIELHRLGEDDLSSARTLERGKLRRCQDCGGIIRKDAWRLSAIYFDGALHLECALTREPEGFRLALERCPNFVDAEEWRSKLAAS